MPQRSGWVLPGWLMLGGLVALGALAMWQDKLLYFPERAAVAEMLSPRLVAWPAPSDVRGLVAEPVPLWQGNVLGTVIVFHGNAGHAGHRSFYADALAPQGFRVILAEYPGYGPRTGALGEASLVSDAVETIAIAHRQYGEPLLLIGESLGAGVVAASAAHQRDKIAGLMLITPWDSLASVAGHHYPWLPIRLLLKDRYDSALHLRTIGIPVLVAVAEHDSIVPAQYGRALYDALTGPRQLLTIPGAEHNDWVDRVDARWWGQALGFLTGRGTADYRPG